MAIINRLARLFKADFHAVLDHIEEPELQLKQSIREMQEELDKTESRLKYIKRDIDALQDREKSAADLIKQTSEEVNVCLANSNDELARGLLRRRLETEQILDSTKQRKKQLAEEQSVLEEQKKEQASLLESMQQKSEVLLDTHSSCTKPGHDTLRSRIQDADIEVALLKEKERFAASNPSG
jgi:phage shock protein A